MEGILLTMFEADKAGQGQVAREVRRHMGETVFKAVIPRHEAVSEAPSFGKPVVWYDLHSVGAQAYLHLAQELLAKRKEKP